MRHPHSMPSPHGTALIDGLFQSAAFGGQDGWGQRGGLMKWPCQGHQWWGWRVHQWGGFSSRRPRTLLDGTWVHRRGGPRIVPRALEKIRAHPQRQQRPGRVRRTHLKILGPQALRFPSGYLVKFNLPSKIVTLIAKLITGQQKWVSGINRNTSCSEVKN